MKASTPQSHLRIRIWVLILVVWTLVSGPSVFAASHAPSPSPTPTPKPEKNEGEAGARAALPGLSAKPSPEDILEGLSSSDALEKLLGLEGEENLKTLADKLGEGDETLMSQMMESLGKVDDPKRRHELLSRLGIELNQKEGALEPLLKKLGEESEESLLGFVEALRKKGVGAGEEGGDLRDLYQRASDYYYRSVTPKEAQAYNSPSLSGGPVDDLEQLEPLKQMYDVEAPRDANEMFAQLKTLGELKKEFDPVFEKERNRSIPSDSEFSRRLQVYEADLNEKIRVREDRMDLVDRYQAMYPPPYAVDKLQLLEDVDQYLDRGLKQTSQLVEDLKKLDSLEGAFAEDSPYGLERDRAALQKKIAVSQERVVDAVLKNYPISEKALPEPTQAMLERAGLGALNAAYTPITGDVFQKQEATAKRQLALSSLQERLPNLEAAISPAMSQVQGAFTRALERSQFGRQRFADDWTSGEGFEQWSSGNLNTMLRTLQGSDNPAHQSASRKINSILKQRPGNYDQRQTDALVEEFLGLSLEEQAAAFRDGKYSKEQLLGGTLRGPRGSVKGIVRRLEERESALKEEIRNTKDPLQKAQLESLRDKVKTSRLFAQNSDLPLSVFGPGFGVSRENGIRERDVHPERYPPELDAARASVVETYRKNPEALAYARFHEAKREKTLEENADRYDEINKDLSFWRGTRFEPPESTQSVEASVGDFLKSQGAPPGTLEEKRRKYVEETALKVANRYGLPVEEVQRELTAYLALDQKGKPIFRPKLGGNSGLPEKMEQNVERALGKVEARLFEGASTALGVSSDSLKKNYAMTLDGKGKAALLSLDSELVDHQRFWGGKTLLYNDVDGEALGYGGTGTKPRLRVLDDSLPLTALYGDATVGTPEGRKKLGIGKTTRTGGGIQPTYDVEKAIIALYTGGSGAITWTAAKTALKTGGAGYLLERGALTVDGVGWRGADEEFQSFGTYVAGAAVLGPLVNLKNRAGAAATVGLGALSGYKAYQEGKQDHPANAALHWGYSVLAGLKGIPALFAGNPKPPGTSPSGNSQPGTNGSNPLSARGSEPKAVPEVISKPPSGEVPPSLARRGSSTPPPTESGGGGFSFSPTGSGPTSPSFPPSGSSGGGVALAAKPKVKSSLETTSSETPGTLRLPVRGSDGASLMEGSLAEGPLLSRLTQLTEAPMEFPLPGAPRLPELTPFEVPKPLPAAPTAPSRTPISNPIVRPGVPSSIPRPSNPTILPPTPATYQPGTGAQTHGSTPPELPPLPDLEIDPRAQEEFPGLVPEALDSEDDTADKSDDETRLTEALEGEGVTLEDGEAEELVQEIEEVTRGLEPSSARRAVEEALRNKGLSEKAVQAVVKGFGLDARPRGTGTVVAQAPSSESADSHGTPDLVKQISESLEAARNWLGSLIPEETDPTAQRPSYWDLLTEEQAEFGKTQLDRVNQARREVGEREVEGQELAIFAKRVQEAWKRSDELMGSNPSLNRETAYAQAVEDLVEAGIMFSGYNTTHSWQMLNDDGQPEGRGHSLHVVFSKVAEEAGGIQALNGMSSAERQVKIREAVTKLYGENPGGEKPVVDRFVREAAVLSAAVGEVPLDLFRSTVNDGRSFDEIVADRANREINSTSGSLDEVAGFYPDDLNNLIIFQYPKGTDGIAIIGDGPGRTSSEELQRLRGKDGFVPNEFAALGSEHGFAIVEEKTVTGKTTVKVKVDTPDGPKEVLQERPYSGTLLVLEPRQPPPEPITELPETPATPDSLPAPGTAPTPSVDDIPRPRTEEPDVISALALSPEKEQTVRNLAASIAQGGLHIAGELQGLYEGLTTNTAQNVSEFVNGLLLGEGSSAVPPGTAVGASAPSTSAASSPLSRVEFKEKLFEAMSQGGLEVEQFLGRGAMGEAYLVKNEKGEEMVAKIIQQGEERTERLEKRLKGQEYEFLKGMYQANEDKEGDERHFLKVDLNEFEVAGKKVPVLVMEKFDSTLGELFSPNSADGERLFGVGRYDQITPQQQKNRDWLIEHLAKATDEMNFPQDPSHPKRVHKDMKWDNMGVSYSLGADREQDKLKNLFVFDPFVLEPDEEYNANGERKMGGTPLYMSSEQWDRKESVSDREALRKINLEIFWGENLIEMRSNPDTKKSFTPLPLGGATINANPNPANLAESQKIALAVMNSNALDRATSAGGPPRPLTEKLDLAGQARSGGIKEQEQALRTLGKAMAQDPVQGAIDLVANPYLQDPEVLKKLEIAPVALEQIFDKVADLKNSPRGPPAPVEANVNSALRLAEQLRQDGSAPAVSPLFPSPPASSPRADKWNEKLARNQLPSLDYSQFKDELGREPTWQDWVEEARKKAGRTVPPSPASPRVGSILGGLVEPEPGPVPVPPNRAPAQVDVPQVLDQNIPGVQSRAGDTLSWQQARSLPSGERQTAIQEFTSQWTQAAVEHIANMDGATAEQKAAAFQQLARTISDRTRTYTGLGGSLPNWRADTYINPNGGQAFTTPNYHLYITPEGKVYGGAIADSAIDTQPGSARQTFYSRWQPHLREDGTSRSDAEIQKIWGLKPVR